LSQAKVVELNLETNRKDPKKRTEFPPVVHAVRQQGKKQINELLLHLFNNTDDALFELADRAQSDAYQVMYFDSMRTIRLHRDAIASHFIQSFVDNFNTVFATDANSSDAANREDPYALVDQDELEMSVAVSGIVSKVTSQFSLPIMQLTKRLDHLAKKQTISERLNPFGPHMLGTAFADALTGLEINIKVRIILMKLFERFVMESLGPIYEVANHTLIEAGVLPDIKTKASKEQSPPRPSAAEQAARVGNASAYAQPAVNLGYSSGANTDGFSFNAVQALLSGVRAFEGDSDAVASGNSIATEDVQRPRLDSTEVLNALSQMQQAASTQSIDTSAIPKLGDIRTLVLSTATHDKSMLMGRADDDTVNFVSMLFDYILNDRNLAIPMKALIGRLQIPIVKLAILDKTFFEKSSHPARALLNELSSAGIGWSSAAELKRDALYDKIESIILRVLNEFTNNPDVFIELLKDLRGFVSKDTRRSVLIEQRVRESEAGKAKATSAKLRVQSLINSKASGLRLPPEAGKFISDQWSRVLTLRHVKHGDEHNAWFDTVATLDDMLWMLQPLSDRTQISQRARRTTSLIEEISSGMQDIGSPEDQINQYTDWLKAHLQQLSRNDLDYLEEDGKPEVAQNLATVEDIILTTVENESEEKLSPELAKALEPLTEGTWVEIREQHNRINRCKLATVTQPGSMHVFVNRRGMKVLEKSRNQLGEMLLDKHLQIINESQVFDRALQSVIGNLRDMQRQRTS